MFHPSCRSRRLGIASVWGWWPQRSPVLRDLVRVRLRWTWLRFHSGHQEEGGAPRRIFQDWHLHRAVRCWWNQRVQPEGGELTCPFFPPTIAHDWPDHFTPRLTSRRNSVHFLSQHLTQPLSHQRLKLPLQHCGLPVCSRQDGNWILEDEEAPVNRGTSKPAT